MAGAWWLSRYGQLGQQHTCADQAFGVDRPAFPTGMSHPQGEGISLVTSRSKAVEACRALWPDGTHATRTPAFRKCLSIETSIRRCRTTQGKSRIEGRRQLFETNVEAVAAGRWSAPEGTCFNLRGG